MYPISYHKVVHGNLPEAASKIESQGTNLECLYERGGLGFLLTRQAAFQANPEAYLQALEGRNPSVERAPQKI